jgi:hypothetical protein
MSSPRIYVAQILVRQLRDRPALSITEQLDGPILGAMGIYGYGRGYVAEDTYAVTRVMLNQWETAGDD